MAQSFSLYSELTARQNLVLHAPLFGLPAGQIASRVQQMVDRFDLAGIMGELPSTLPMGDRQRLSLAVAMIYGPEMLIGFDVVWPEFLSLAAIGVALFALSLARFRRALATMA